LNSNRVKTDSFKRIFKLILGEEASRNSLLFRVERDFKKVSLYPWSKKFDLDVGAKAYYETFPISKADQRMLFECQESFLESVEYGDFCVYLDGMKWDQENTTIRILIVPPKMGVSDLSTLNYAESI
jgi:hypothetical protein